MLQFRQPTHLTVPLRSYDLAWRQGASRGCFRANDPDGFGASRRTAMRRNSRPHSWSRVQGCLVPPTRPRRCSGEVSKPAGTWSLTPVSQQPTTADRLEARHRAEWKSDFGHCPFNAATAVRESSVESTIAIISALLPHAIGRLQYSNDQKR